MKPLESVIHEFADWRHKRKYRGPFPDELRGMAVDLLQAHKAREVAQALGLNVTYLYQWQKALKQQSLEPSDFVELPRPSEQEKKYSEMSIVPKKLGVQGISQNLGTCDLEIERGDGRKMRLIHPCPDLVRYALSSFLEGEVK